MAFGEVLDLPEWNFEPRARAPLLGRSELVVTGHWGRDQSRALELLITPCDYSSALARLRASSRLSTC